jgi:hypothetical protein
MPPGRASRQPAQTRMVAYIGQLGRRVSRHPGGLPWCCQMDPAKAPCTACNAYPRPQHPPPFRSMRRSAAGRSTRHAAGTQQRTGCADAARRPRRAAARSLHAGRRYGARSAAADACLALFAAGGRPRGPCANGYGRRATVGPACGGHSAARDHPAGGHPEPRPRLPGPARDHSGHRHRAHRAGFRPARPRPRLGLLRPAPPGHRRARYGRAPRRTRRAVRPRRSGRRRHLLSPAAGHHRRRRGRDHRARRAAHRGGPHQLRPPERDCHQSRAIPFSAIRRCAW